MHCRPERFIETMVWKTTRTFRRNDEVVVHRNFNFDVRFTIFCWLASMFRKRCTSVLNLAGLDSFRLKEVWRLHFENRFAVPNSRVSSQQLTDRRGEERSHFQVTKLHMWKCHAKCRPSGSSCSTFNARFFKNRSGWLGDVSHCHCSLGFFTFSQLHIETHPGMCSG